MFADLLNNQTEFIFNNLSMNQPSHEYSTSELENKYLDQFFQQGVLDSENQSQKITNDNHENIDKIEEETRGIVNTKNPRIKSKFHNYQKHLIITLRKTVDIQKHPAQRSNLPLIQLWEAFCSSKSYNKSLLRILFGEHMIEEELNLGLFKKEGFKSIVERYSSDEVIEAQHSLRKLVLDHFQHTPLDGLLKSRKLPKQTKILFKKYLSEFIEELEQGNVMKRLPKSKKKQILTSS